MWYSRESPRPRPRERARRRDGRGMPSSVYRSALYIGAPGPSGRRVFRSASAADRMPSLSRRSHAVPAPPASGPRSFSASPRACSGCAARRRDQRLHVTERVIPRRHRRGTGRGNRSTPACRDPAASGSCAEFGHPVLFGAAGPILDVQPAPAVPPRAPGRSRPRRGAVSRVRGGRSGHGEIHPGRICRHGPSGLACTRWCRASCRTRAPASRTTCIETAISARAARGYIRTDWHAAICHESDKAAEHPW